MSQLGYPLLRSSWGAWQQGRQSWRYVQWVCTCDCATYTLC